jgi:hypothetical protein
MSAQLAHAQRSEPVDFVGIAHIAHIAYKLNLGTDLMAKT